MHPDSLRSVVYRSFVTCDDAKGVVECGTIRKSKCSSQKMEHKIKIQKAKKSLDTTFSSKAKKKEEMESKGISEELLSPSSFQILEVSKGAQKLNQMIDALSKGKNFDGQAEDVAKDMLKGALDLQESLMMLGQLQEASHYIAWVKKQQQKSLRRKNDEVGIERVNSHHLGEQNYQMGFQKPRLSADGSSRDNFEEFRNSIRASLARQNLLLKTDNKEKISFHQRCLDSASEITSSTSSQSSITNTNNYCSIDSPLSSATPEKKAKGPNLIAKLMGLEECSSKPLQKELKNETISRQQRTIFDFDIPKIRKIQLVGRHEKQEHRSLKEILETMHFTGLLKSNSIKGFKAYSHYSSDSHAKKSLIGNNSPIVLMKPLRDQVCESEEPFAPTSRKKDVQETKMMLKELKVKEEFPSKAADSKEKVLKSGKMSSKPETEEISIKRLSKEEGAKEIKKVSEKPEEAKVKQRCCNKKNSSGQVTNQPQKKKVIDKKADENPKAVITSRKPMDKEIDESKNVSRSRDQVKMSASRVEMREKGSSATKNQTCRQQNSAPNPTAIHTNHNSNDRRRSLIKKGKPVSDPTVAKSTDVGSKEDEKKIDFACQSDTFLTESNDTCVDQLTKKEETDATEFQEHCNNTQSSLNNAVLSNSQCVRDPKVVDEFNNISDIRMDSKGYKLKLLLSSNAAFLSHAEELFDLNVNCPTSLQTSGIDDIVVTNERLSIDIAKELVERISLPDSKLVRPLLLTWLRNSTIHISLDKLLEEVSDGIDSLESYSKLASETEKLPTDSIHAMVEKDIRCKGIVNGIWDLGWRNEFSTDNTEQVVNDIEKLLLSGLIDEIIT